MDSVTRGIQNGFWELSREIFRGLFFFFEYLNIVFSFLFLILLGTY